MPDAEIEDFTIATMPARFARLGDVHAGIDEPATVGSLEPLLELADRDERDRGLADAPVSAAVPEDAGGAEAGAALARQEVRASYGTTGGRWPGQATPTPTLTSSRAAPEVTCTVMQRGWST